MLKRALKIDISPYSALAPIYDTVMEHVDYERWAVYVKELLQKFDCDAKWILDLSCGTGSCCTHLDRLGYRVSGADRSFPMLQQSKKKAKGNCHRIGYYCADMLHQPLKKQPDVVISLYDSMNYLMTAAEWRRGLQDIHSILAQKGLFIFDVSTLHNSLRAFSNYSQKGSAAAGQFFRRSSFDRRARIQTNRFEITLNDQPGRIFRETHKQVILPLEEIIGFVETSPFKLMNGYKNFTFKPFSEKSERVHFVLKKC